MPESSALRQNGAADATENATKESDEDSRGFALNVDLSECVGLPAHFRVWVQHNCRRRARTMRWLGEHVRRAADIRGPFLMLVDKYLLPPNESLSLLRSCDAVRLARVENEWQRPFSYNNSDDDPPTPPDHPVIVNKTPKGLVEPRASPPVKHSLPTLPDNAIKQTFEPSPVPTPDFQPSSVTDENLQRVKRRALALLHQVTGQEQEQEGQDNVDAPKKRRRRVRRRRPARPISPFIEPTEPMSVSTESPASTSINLTPSLPKASSNPDTSLQDLPSSDIPQSSDSITAPSSIPDTSSRAKSPLASTPLSPTSALASSPSSPETSQSTPMILSTTLLTLEPTREPVVRNQSSSRAPRVVRALDIGPNELIMTDSASLRSTE